VGEIRYEFAALGDGNTALNTSANAIADAKDTWRQMVGKTLESWLDQAGGIFNELGVVWDSAAAKNVEHQAALAQAVAQSQTNGENALAQCVAALGN
jgi:uncharacterized protein YukE